jgi:hypothetical protein
VKIQHLFPISSWWTSRTYLPFPASEHSALIPYSQLQHEGFAKPSNFPEFHEFSDNFFEAP